MTRSIFYTLNACALFFCASMYLGTGGSLVLFQFPMAAQLTIDNYYLPFVLPITAATKFFTVMAMAMLVFAAVMFVGERKTPLRWYAVAVFVLVLGAALLTRYIIFPYNWEMAAGIRDPERLRQVLHSWMAVSRIRALMWTAQWVLMMAFFAHKLLRAERPAASQAPAAERAEAPRARRWVEVKP